MSSISAAKKRRAGIQPNSSPEPQSSQSSSFQNNQPKQPLTIVQVIASIDKRLISLETFVNIQQEQVSNKTNENHSNTNENALSEQNTTMFKEYMEDMNTKFEILAEEITNLKDIVLKLQTYTMDVNKILMKERTQLLSTTEETDTKPISMENNNTSTSNTNTGYVLENENHVRFNETLEYSSHM